jgi:hypothetical protein
MTLLLANVGALSGTAQLPFPLETLCRLDGVSRSRTDGLHSIAPSFAYSAEPSNHRARRVSRSRFSR